MPNNHVRSAERQLAAGTHAYGREIDRVSRDVIIDAGHGDHYGHGLGHGIGLATHEMPSLGKNAPETPLPSPTVFSVEPGMGAGFQGPVVGIEQGLVAAGDKDEIRFGPAQRRQTRGLALQQAADLEQVIKRAWL